MIILKLTCYVHSYRYIAMNLLACYNRVWCRYITPYYSPALSEQSCPASWILVLLNSIC